MESTQKQESVAPQEVAGTSGKRSFWQRRPVIVIGTVVLFGLLFYGLRYLAESLTHEWTDDAFLDADVVSVAPKVGGQVKQVHVRSNQVVKAGELLVEIDPRDLAVLLEQKRAALKATQASSELLKASFELRRTSCAPVALLACRPLLKRGDIAPAPGKSRPPDRLPPGKWCRTQAEKRPQARLRPARG
jgi:multidrug resistance efflux pump